MTKTATKELPMSEKPVEQKQAEAQAWFRELRDQICAEFEGLEDALESGPHADMEAGRFSREVWDRNESSESRAQSSEASFCEQSEAIHAKDAAEPGWTAASAGASSQKEKPKNTDPYACGGGEISIMKGRVFEKVGVNISTVTGKFSEAFQREMPGGAETPFYWAAGISLVAHMRSPLVPAVHMNTRMICLGDAPWVAQKSGIGNWESGNEGGAERGQKAEPLVGEAVRPIAQASRPEQGQNKTRLWFGGGADLNPMFEIEQDTADFHAAFKAVCDEADPAYYEAFKAWCDEYFYIPHRGEARGVGGIFYDYLGFNQGAEESFCERSAAIHTKDAADSAWTATSASASSQKENTKNFGGSNAFRGPHTQAGMQLTMADTKDWEARFAFTKAVGEAFRDIYPEIARRHIHEEWSEEQRAWQLEKRGRYAEYNLLLDRGTRFGLMTGGNPKAILMSLPPMASWA